MQVEKTSVRKIGGYRVPVFVNIVFHDEIDMLGATTSKIKRLTCVDCVAQVTVVSHPDQVDDMRACHQTKTWNITSRKSRS